MESFFAKLYEKTGIEDLPRRWDSVVLDLPYVRLPLVYPQIKLGLCCINTVLRKKKIYNSRTCIRRTFTPEKALELAYNNLADFPAMFRWNAENGIWSHRMSSDLCPHYTDREVESYTLDSLKEVLKKAGDAARFYHQRLTFHPGQYTLLAPLESRILEASIRDLQYHTDIFNLMGCDKHSVMMIHGGGLYGDKESAIRRWIDNYSDLPKDIKERLCLENCEKCYSIGDCLHISDETKVPVVLDDHHYACYKYYCPSDRQKEIEEVIPHVLDTWGDKEPLFHISQQAPGERIGKHSDFIDSLPKYYLDIERPYTLEVEAKMKEQAILPLIEKHDKCKTVYNMRIELID